MSTESPIAVAIPRPRRTLQATVRWQKRVVTIGGDAPVRVQSMTNTDTADVIGTAIQVKELALAGSELVRITVNNDDAAKAVPAIREQLDRMGIDVPLVGDFHYNGHRLLNDHPACAEALSKYRINPGNVGRGEKHDKQFAQMVEAALRWDRPVRIGVNWGSLDQDLLARLMDDNARRSAPWEARQVMYEALITSAIDSAQKAVELGMRPEQVLLSCKVSGVQDLIAVYRELARRCHHPLHLGLTEAGMATKGTVASAAALSILLQEGIGDTIRVSLTPQPGESRTQEVVIATEILQALGLRVFVPSVTACPGCGRTTSTTFQELAKQIDDHLRAQMPVWRARYPGVESLRVAVMGCIVNGPGESKHADIGISLPGTGESPAAPVFIDGEKVATLRGEGIAQEFHQMVEDYIQKRFGAEAPHLNTIFRMADRLSAVKGMNDLLPTDSHAWEWLEDRVRELMRCHGYRNIRTPVVEPTALFVRGLGEVTDIVEKEMYSFVDHLNGERLTLRPEATAGVVRAVVEHNLLYDGGKRLYYMGPMFRHERPQKGRYRQFHQIGAEVLGFGGPEVDAELIVMAHALWQSLGLSDVRLELNSLGQPDERSRHRAALIAYFEARSDQLDEDAKRRLHSNPLRILDSKNPSMQALVEGAPKLMDHLGETSRAHFDQVCAILEQLGVSYRINPRLVRGMDYYNLTVFEFVTERLGSQGTICGGGRYDYLIEQVGGKPAPAVGWALGVERVLELVRESGAWPTRTGADVYAIVPQAERWPAVMQCLHQLRGLGLSVQMHASGPEGLGSMKSQFKKADASGATHALIFGPDEWAQGQVLIKSLRDGQGAQRAVALADWKTWAPDLKTTPQPLV